MAGMRISLNITDHSWSGPPADELGRIARAADDAALDTVWVPDHLLQTDPTSTPEAPLLEAYTALGYLAAITERVRLGTMVAAAAYRPPAVVIKAVTTVDVLSGGRAWLGLGSGYSDAEAAAMGLPLPAVAERFSRLEDTVRLAHHMWCGDESPFHGVCVHLERPLCRPRPVNTPHPPILVGGMGEKKTLRIVARYADACNLFDLPDGGRTVRHKLDVLSRHCDDVGRRRDDIATTVSTRFEPSEPDRFADRCHALAEAGADHVVAIRTGPWTVGDVASLGRAATSLSRP